MSFLPSFQDIKMSNFDVEASNVAAIKDQKMEEARLSYIQLLILFHTNPLCNKDFFRPILASSKKEFLDIFSR